ncbi:MAG: ABC transporter ATP-binding protein [Alphaproteobacteria bacterium]|nr:ABC transporter ATP-binding protein [Alphaproteobacteria bacterium]
MKNVAVHVKNMSVRFGDFYAVRNVSFDVARGEIFGFLGANGAGKTTTIRVLCGLLPASAGDVEIDGEKFIAGRENIIKRKVGYMSQRFTLYDGLSVKENFDFAAALRRLDIDQYVKRRQKLLDFIGFDRGLNTLVKNLPGGIKQEVALCVALLHDPQIVFLDEPTAGVAPVARQRFWSLIKKLAKDKKTIFVTTHYMDEAENCNRIALMRAGELIAIDTPSELKRTTFVNGLYRLRPRHAKAKAPDMVLVDIWQPYGRDFHLRFKEDVSVAHQIKVLKADWEIEQIQPSLEDVFVQLVEGQNR